MSGAVTQQFLHLLGDTELNYKFENVGRLAQDYQKGGFCEAFHCAAIMHVAAALDDSLPLL